MHEPALSSPTFRPHPLCMIVEVDGATVHTETPAEAHERTKVLLDEGAHIERIDAKECSSLESARQCASKILQTVKKIKHNK